MCTSTRLLSDFLIFRRYYRPILDYKRMCWHNRQRFDPRSKEKLLLLKNEQLIPDLLTHTVWNVTICLLPGTWIAPDNSDMFQRTPEVGRDFWSLSCLAPLQAGSPTSGYPASCPGEQLHLADLKSLPRYKEDNLSFLLTWLEANFGIRNRLCKIPSFLRPVFPLLRILSYCHPLEQKFSVYRARRI